MLRPFFFFAAALLSAPSFAQVPAAAISGADCLVRVNATPTSWLIQGYDPFGGSTPEATFNVTFVNEGSAECRFVPLFQLDQPPFGLSKGTGKPIGYALLNMTDTQDVTPRAGRTQRIPSQRMLILGANDVVNPAARTDPGSPIFGMPILNVDQARSIVVLKRSMAAGYSGVENELFYHERCAMLFGDAKESVQTLITSVKEV